MRERYNKIGRSLLFGVEEQVGRCAFEVGAEAGLGDGGVVEGVPAAVERVAAVRSVVAEVDVPRMVDHADQLVGGALGAAVLRGRDQPRQVQRFGHPEAVVELLLAELAEGEALDLQHQHAGQPVEVQLAPALAEGSIGREVLLHLAQ